MPNDSGLTNTDTVQKFYYKSGSNLEVRLSTWQKYGQNKRKLSEFIVNTLFEKNTKQGSWLDVGCGTGDLLGYLAQNFFDLELYGVDISSAMVSLTKKKVPLKFRKNIVESNAFSLPFANLAFKFISIVHVLHHIPKEQVKKFIAHILSYLDTNGTLVLSLPKFELNKGLNKIHYQSLADLNFPGFMTELPTTYYSSDTIMRSLVDQDLLIKKVEYKNELIFPDVKPAIDYYQTAMMYRGSNGPEDNRINKSSWIALNKKVDAEIEKIIQSKGVFTVPGNVEILICQKK